MKKRYSVTVSIFSVVLSSLLLLTSLDNKIYDLFLRTIPTLNESDKVLIVKVDDISIEKVGIFPWGRDILADCIVFMRELGAKSVSFDLSYLDESPKAIDRDYLTETFPQSLEGELLDLETLTNDILDSIANREIPLAQVQDYKEELSSFNISKSEYLLESLGSISRDNDAHFADTLDFFDEALLAITMILEESILGDIKEIDMSHLDTEYLGESIALKNVDGTEDSITPVTLGIDPAISQLLTRSKGAGFVNADPDRDGIRRRVHLVMKYEDKYYGQLGFVTLLNALGNPTVEITNNHILIKSDNSIKIPRTRDGSVLIKWPKKRFDKYNTLSAWYLIRNKEAERAVVQNLKGMDANNFFSALELEESPLDYYEYGEMLKEELFSGAQEGIEEYIAAREMFIELSRETLSEEKQSELLLIAQGDEELEAFINDSFSIARDNLNTLIEIREFARERVEDSYSIIGIDATAMTDVGQTTYQERFPNVGIYSTLMNMFLSNEFIDDAPLYLTILIAIFATALLSLIIKRMDTKYTLMAGFISLIVTLGTLLVIFIGTKRYIGVAVPITSLSITFLTLSIINFMTTLREKSFLRNAFSRYLSPDVIKDIIDDPSKLNLGGEKKLMTCIFTDIQGFSTISESMEPVDLVKLLNLYLTRMSDIALEYRGTIDKYEGDAIIAFFGAPISMDNHAEMACHTAIRMKRAEVEINSELKQMGLTPFPLFTRIGINTGEMVVGNMGTANKMDYTIIGNAVNLAARLEGVNKQYNTRGVLISEETYKETKGQFLVRRLDRVRVVGVNTPLRLYELIDELETASKESLEYYTKWSSGIDLYDKGDFTGALEIFTILSSRDKTDGVAKLFIDRCRNYIENTPSLEWDGVSNLVSK